MKTSQKASLAALLVILLLAGALRFYGLDAQSLWNDEGTSVALARQGLGAIARAAALDIHPPLYYWLLSGWVRLLGDSETAVRALSALLGVGLVALTFALGQRLAGPWTGLWAALWAAIHPFQIYYSQEARMYMLLAVVTAATVWALVRWVDGETWTALGALVLLEAVGLYTHYSYLFCILIVNLAYLLWLALNRRSGLRPAHVLRWTAAQGAVVLLYLPWLPTALRQVTTWPSPTQDSALGAALAHTWQWLVLGPTAETGRWTLALLLAVGLAGWGVVALALGAHRENARRPRLGGATEPDDSAGRPWGQGPGDVHLRARWAAGLGLLWLGLPVILMFALGLYREAYLKFLLVNAPALCLLMACGLTARLPGSSVTGARLVRGLQGVVALVALASSLVVLWGAYTDPVHARDDYRGIAAYIEAVGQPGDLVILNAPGQQEVFGYYYRGALPVVPLPESRPPDPAQTEAALADHVQPGTRVFAVLWATDESDPQRLVEGWLDRSTFKALDSWYGNVRLAVYAAPEQAPAAPEFAVDAWLKNPETGDEVRLVGSNLLNERLAAGDIAQLALFWQVEAQPVQRYKVFVHVLDGGNQIVGQRDAEPGGGVLLTTVWEPGEPVIDYWGVPIHPATPPGRYRVEVGMYNPETGQRLLTADGEGQIWLEPLVVERPLAPAPTAALGMQHEAGADLGGLVLLGYDLYRLGMEHQPDAPLRPGDLLHVNLYWTTSQPLPGDWGVEIAVVDAGGRVQVQISGEPVGGYPTGQWQAGDLWRGQFALPLPADLPGGRYRLRIGAIAPDGDRLHEFLAEPFWVGD